MENDKYAWVIAYVDVNHIKNVEIDMQKNSQYADITAYIPTVKVLKKVFKGDESFEEVPLLFNYGFFYIPINKAKQRTFLEGMKQDISCIFGWVSDPAKTLRVKPDLYDNNICIFTESHIPYATANSQEIADLVDMARESTIFSAAELGKLSVGDIITLKGYPWDGMDATILSIDVPKKKVNVSLLLFQQMKEIQVSFDSVFFTMYREDNYNSEVLSKDSMDSIKNQYQKDKITFNLNINAD